MGKRIIKININQFNNEIKDMSYVEIGKYLIMLINLDKDYCIDKNILEEIYSMYIPKYINKKITKLDYNKYKINNIKSV